MAKKEPLRHFVQIGKRKFKLHTNDAFLPEYTNQIIKATTPQMRNLAYGSYNLLIDKITEGTTYGFKPRLRKERLKYYNKKYTDRHRGEERKPFKHKKLSDSWLAYKVRNKLDPRALIATGFYLKHIKVVVKAEKNRTIYSVVIPPNIKHKPSGIRLEQLARWLEFGTAGPRKMPPRPHWRPVARMVKAVWKKLPATIRTIALREALKVIR